MPRTARATVGGVCYHVINRANGRARIFHDADDYRAFERLLAAASKRHTVRLIAYCLMPNHFHLVVIPDGDGDLSRWMQWLMTSHVRRHHRRYGTDGRLWQGRYKAFAVQDDRHLVTVLRYVERNPLRANLVSRAEAWPWSSLARRATGGRASLLGDPPFPLPADWLAFVNSAETAAELESLRRSVNRERPFGDATWQAETARRLGLVHTMRPRGRPPGEGKRGHSTFSRAG